jgi:hypothetical protein
MTIKIGDKVRFTPEWLRSAGIYTGDFPRAGGPVVHVGAETEGRALVTFDCPILGRWCVMNLNLEVYK